MADPNSSIDFSQKLSELGKLLAELSSASGNEFRQILITGICRLLDVPVCILWEKQKESKFRIVAYHGNVDREYQSLELNAEDRAVKQNLLKTCKVWSSNLEKVSNKFVYRDEIKARNWVSIMSATLKEDGGNPIGILDVYTTKKYCFQWWEKDLFRILADRVSIFLVKNELFNKCNKAEADRNRLRNMTTRMLKMNEAETSEKVWNSLYDGVSEILENDSKGEINIEVGKIDRSSNTPNISINEKLTDIISFINATKKIERENYDIKRHLQLSNEEGTISKAIRELTTVRVDRDPTKDPIDLWRDARSEITIPMVEQVLIREGTEVKKGFKKCIGIVSITSSFENAFTDMHINRIELLINHASSIIEKIDFFEKSKRIRKIERSIRQSQDYDFVMEKIIEGIEILEFEWINISLINTITDTIEAKKIRGIEEKNILKRFKRDANHPLKGKDIQARIIKNKQIEVPFPEDSGFDREVYKNYGHDRLIRVFLPIIEPSTDLAIGTVEAGYRRKYKPHIYEKDVAILKNFVDDAAHAIEREKSKLIDRISHELKSPIVGIRANASFIQRTFDSIKYNPQHTVVKMQDILTDCDLLLHQVRQFEYFLGRVSSEKINVERFSIFRDIILKTINELSYYMKDEYGFSVDKIKFDRDLIQRIVVRTDKAKLNQVVFNLVINSLKYAKKDPDAFQLLIEVEIDDDNNNFVIKFKDWGIGIKETDKAKLFKEGFRSSEATAKVSGSGLGLNISATIMKQLGGDLKLVNNLEPTEFHLILPR